MFRPKSIFFQIVRKLVSACDKNGGNYHRPSFKFKQIVENALKHGNKAQPYNLPAVTRLILVDSGTISRDKKG